MKNNFVTEAEDGKAMNMQRERFRRSFCSKDFQINNIIKKNNVSDEVIPDIML